FALPRLSPRTRRGRRIQRQVHGQPARAARGILPDAAGAYPRYVPQLLLPAAALADDGPAAARGWVDQRPSTTPLLRRFGRKPRYDPRMRRLLFTLLAVLPALAATAALAQAKWHTLALGRVIVDAPAAWIAARDADDGFEIVEPERARWT